jgi:outer membrane protein assembly factor BamE (lipoprotein component of BamABCDE complex)
MLQYITIKPDENPKTYYSYLGITYVLNKRCDYVFHYQHNSVERKKQYIDDDSISVVITINKNGNIHYDIGIYKLKPKEENSINRRKIFYKGNMNDCDWNFITYQYNRN